LIHYTQESYALREVILKRALLLLALLVALWVAWNGNAAAQSPLPTPTPPNAEPREVSPLPTPEPRAQTYTEPQRADNSDDGGDTSPAPAPAPEDAATMLPASGSKSLILPVALLVTAGLIAYVRRQK
jgi:hypothetical protein